MTALTHKLASLLQSIGWQPIHDPQYENLRDVMPTIRIMFRDARTRPACAQTGRDLYNASIVCADHSLPALPEWCDLDDIEQAAWNAKAKDP